MTRTPHRSIPGDRVSRRRGVALLVATVALAVSLATGSSPSRAEEALGPVVVSMQGEGESCLAEGRCTRFNGRSVVHQQFLLHAGPVVIRTQHTGARDIVAELVLAVGDQPVAEAPRGWNQAFEWSSTVVWATGDYTGAAVSVVPRTGLYAVSVQATGSWSISVEQVAPGAPVTNARTFEGRGDTVAGLVRLPAGRYTLHATQDVNSFFMVTLYDVDGNRLERPDGVDLIRHPGALHVPEAGRVDEHAAFEVPVDGVYLLAVRALGAWRVEVQ